MPRILNKTEICMYGLHRLQGLFPSCDFLIGFLKTSNDVSFLNSLGTIFQIFGLRNEIFSVPQKPLLKLGQLNSKNCRKL